MFLQFTLECNLYLQRYIKVSYIIWHINLLHLERPKLNSECSRVKYMHVHLVTY